jgi:flagellar hook protein FlgE
MSFSSMYVGATGVIAHGDRMQVIANNLANVSTIGYKKADALFGDLMSKNLASGNGQYNTGNTFASQIGLGVGLSEVRNLFAEGGLENTTTFTDLAITGNGFFGTRDTSAGSSSGATHYTRAGAFRFNNDAYMVDPHDFRLQGYAVDRETGEVATAVSDVQLPYEDVIVDGEELRVVRSDPRATTGVEMVTNLDALATDQYTSTTSPFFAMLQAYDGTLADGSPFGENLPAYSSSLTIYDSDGNEHDMTVYFDPVSSASLSNAAPGYTYWEYLVALPATSDGSSAFGTSAAGLAGAGVLTFNGSGEMVGQSSFALNTASGANAKDLSAWGPASFNTEGLTQFLYTYGSNGSAIGSQEAVAYDFGMNSTTSSWLSGASTAAGVGFDPANLSQMADPDRDARITTSYDESSYTAYQIQDGYTWGYLLNASVDREGFLSGYFTNGQTEEFYQIANYRFNSEWGLRRDGNNNFVATDASGSAMDGKASSGGRGVFQQNTLEMSNVDMAEEFANMIITQRGYQANTKVITTSDSLLNTTISIKR